MARAIEPEKIRKKSIQCITQIGIQGQNQHSLKKYNFSIKSISPNVKARNCKSPQSQVCADNAGPDRTQLAWT